MPTMIGNHRSGVNRPANWADLSHNGAMRHSSLRVLGLAALLAPTLAAFSPRFHEAQTMLAVRLAPRRMAAFLGAYPGELAQGARGKANDQVPTVEEVEDQFQRIVTLSEQNPRPERLVRELGTLAHQVQLLMDPSAVRGATPLRDSFEAYGDDNLAKLILSREPFWAVTGSLDPRQPLLHMAKVKFDRHQSLLECFDEKTSRRVGPWDDLSVPFALLQLTYSNGVNATANLWIQLWRQTGDRWPLQE
jgi:hypothetical protein